MRLTCRGRRPTHSGPHGTCLQFVLLVTETSMICMSSIYNSTIIADFHCLWERSEIKNKFNPSATDGHIETSDLMYSANQFAGLTMNEKT